MISSQTNNSITRKGACKNCSQPFTMSGQEFLVRCKKCNDINVFLCHPLTASKQHQYRCEICHTFYTLLKCPKCEGYWAVRELKNGFQVRCPCPQCKYEGVIVICPNQKCLKYLCLPLKSQNGNYLNHERSTIQCKHCSTKFRYWICKLCYCSPFTWNKDKNDDSKIFKCSNKKCPDYDTFRDSCWPLKEERKICKYCSRAAVFNTGSSCGHEFCRQCAYKKTVQTCSQCQQSISNSQYTD